MDLETVFAVANAVALLGWLPLVVAPGHPWVRAGATVAVTFLLTLAYVVLLLTGLGTADGGFGSLAEVTRLFAAPRVVLVGWLHYLAFDLFVGTWIALDWRRTGRRHAWIVPVLLLTFWAGPAGLFVYLVVRTIVRRDARVDLGGESSSGKTASTAS